MPLAAVARCPLGAKDLPCGEYRREREKAADGRSLPASREETPPPARKHAPGRDPFRSGCGVWRTAILRERADVPLARLHSGTPVLPAQAGGGAPRAGERL